MKFGLIDAPYTLDYEVGDRTLQELNDWSLQVTRWADEYGLDEVFFTEHYTIGREPSPAPDLMIAAASQLTKRIRLGAAGHLLPYHNPVSLAHRLMWLDHLTGGRYIAGFAPGAFPTDAQLFGTRDENVEMMREALEIILAIWTREGPFEIEGKYWRVDMPGYNDAWQGPHLKPLQQPHPPIASVGARPTSPSLMHAGRRGFLPISQQLSSEVLKQHWEAYSSGAEAEGKVPRRQDWRIVRNFFVADSDEVAIDHVVNGEMGRVYRDHVLGILKMLGLASHIAPIPENEITVEYLAENFWVVGSPDTVVEKLTTLQDETGGFGTLLGTVFDYSDHREAYRRSLELLGREVAPRVEHLGQGVVTESAV